MQIFSNLLSNAIKYTQEGGIIQFIAEESETNSSTYGKYHFIVSDNGLGMAITKNLVESMGERLRLKANRIAEVVLK